MPSLDGYSLNEEIKKLRKDVYAELSSMRKSFQELYGYIAKKESKVAKPKPKAKKVEQPKKEALKEEV